MCGANRQKRGRKGSKRAHIVVNKTSSTLPWTEIESYEDFDSMRFNFTGEAQGLLPPDATPLDVFSKFFDDHMISLLVEVTITGKKNTQKSYYLYNHL